jgi:hypothetical protein
LGVGERVGAGVGEGWRIAGENIHSPGFMSGSENWLGAGMGTLSCSESVLAFSRTGVGIAGRGSGIVPSGSGVGLGVDESIGAGVGDDETVSGARSGVGVGSGTFVNAGN